MDTKEKRPETKYKTMTPKNGWLPDPDRRGGQRYYKDGNWTNKRRSPYLEIYATLLTIPAIAGAAFILNLLG